MLELKNVSKTFNPGTVNEKKALEVRDLLQTAVPTIDILVRQTAPIIATHGGPGAFAVMFYAEKA